jgi:hypothetical protein
VFVVEAFAPEIAVLDGQNVRSELVTIDPAVLGVSAHDSVAKLVESQYIVVD